MAVTASRRRAVEANEPAAHRHEQRMPVAASRRPPLRQRPHWTERPLLAQRPQRHRLPRARAVALGLREVDADAVRFKLQLEVPPAQPRQLPRPQRTMPAEQQQRTVAPAANGAPAGAHHPAQHGQSDRPGLALARRTLAGSGPGCFAGLGAVPRPPTSAVAVPHARQTPPDGGRRQPGVVHFQDPKPGQQVRVAALLRQRRAGQASAGQVRRPRPPIQVVGVAGVGREGMALQQREQLRLAVAFAPAKAPQRRVRRRHRPSPIDRA